MTRAWSFAVAWVTIFSSFRSVQRRATRGLIQGYTAGPKDAWKSLQGGAGASRLPRGTHHTPQVETVEERYERLMGEYKKLLGELENIEDPEEQTKIRLRISGIHWRLARAWRTLERYELQKTEPAIPVEVHVIRIGDMAIATNPFELYLDYGMQMKARSKAVQTFIVQLATPSSGYVPTQRSVAGGAYGAIPESTQIGPEGGSELVEQTLGIIESLWNR